MKYCTCDPNDEDGWAGCPIHDNRECTCGPQPHEREDAIHYYVDAAYGHDSNSGLTFATPKRTLGGLHQTITKTTVVYLRGTFGKKEEAEADKFNIDVEHDGSLSFIDSRGTVYEPNPSNNGCPKHDCFPISPWTRADEESLIERHPEFAKSFTRKIHTGGINPNLLKRKPTAPWRTE